VTSGPADSSDGFRIDLLGPVEAWVDGRPVALGGQRARALLAVLALRGGRVVTVDRLIDELWGDDPPARARASVQMHVSRLRKGLADAGTDGGRLASHAGGYRLDVRVGERDLDRWQQALDGARQARADGEPRAAREGIEEALGVWRGQPLGGVSTSSLLTAERARLEEERLAAVIEGIELDLELGRHGDLPGQLQALVAAHPFTERLVELQMLALYRCGRQADALAAFRATRERFVDELGIEPAQRLRILHERVLMHAPEVSAPADAQQQPRGATPSALRTRGLPVPPNRTIGRDRDIVAVGERLRAGPARLLTLTGPGGVGKTRLAVEAARAVRADFADGAHFVSLAAVHRPADVPAAIVTALGIAVLPGESAEQAAERFLVAKELLLITDNFEQLLAAAPFIARLLAVCPSLTVLATSREPLAIQAEERYPVSPLALPEHGRPQPLGALAGTDAVTLFCDRARVHDPGFDLGEENADAVAEICRRVDGLPLAVELAAAHCGLLSPSEIAERLEATLAAPGAGARDAPARQQTLRATIDWSHELLNNDEQRCFARFAVFAGGATIEAAETITATGLHTLEGLVAKNLLTRRRHPPAPTRLAMLETIRTYAAARFSSAAEAEAVREGHYRHFLAVAEHEGADQALMGVGRKQHLARLDEEIHNLDAALRWALGQPDAGAALAIVAALSSYWELRDRYEDAIDRIDRALAMSGAEDHPATLARALLAKAVALRWRGRVAEQPAIVAQAQSVARSVGDPLLLARVLNSCSGMWAVAGYSDAADAVAEEALRCATAAHDEWEIAQAWVAKASAVSTLSELRARVDRAASLLEAVGNVVRLGQLFCDAAYGALTMGGDRDAMELAGRAAPIVRDLDTPGTWMILRGNTGLAALLTGDTDAARDAFREQLEICRELVALPIACEGLLGLAGVAVVDGNLEHAARLRGAATAHRYGLQQDAIEVRLQAAFFASAREHHGPNAWDVALRAGAELGWDDAIAEALDQQRAQSASPRSSYAGGHIDHQSPRAASWDACTVAPAPGIP
jgi:predicted ATPase/DNA-binding SARP family transcriptional activator